MLANVLLIPTGHTSAPVKHVTWAGALSVCWLKSHSNIFLSYGDVNHAGEGWLTSEQHNLYIGQKITTS